MQDNLPPIDIAIRCTPLEFLDRMTPLVSAELFKADRRQSDLGKEHFESLNLHYQGSTPHLSLGVQLIARSNLPSRVAVEVRAARWSPNPPTYECYCAAAHLLLLPLLKTYNKRFGTRSRLRIPSKQQLEPRLSPQSAELFERFVQCANTSLLHHLDWHRFYEFVHHSRSKPLDEESMMRLLIKHGFAPEYALEIATIYSHLCEFKSFC